MFEPSYYKTNYRALRLREMVRWYGGYLGVREWLKTRFMAPTKYGTWLPGLWAENECKLEDLSQDFWQDTKPHRTDFEKLGFVQCRLGRATKKSDKISNPAVLDSGNIFYLDPARCHIGQLIYFRQVVPSNGKVINNIVLAFTAVFEGRSLSCTNNRLSYDSADHSKVIRMSSYDVNHIYNRFQEELKQSGEAPRPFKDIESLRQWFDARQNRNFEGHVRRRLYIRMTEPEVAAAWAERQRYPAGWPPPLHRRRFQLDLVTTTFVLIGVISVILQLYQHGQRRDRPVSIAGDTIQYYGQQFKMSRPYDSYEDYKDDPNNLDTNDLSRIEQAMEAVETPASFKNDKEFIDFIFDLKFPGYGVGGIGTSIQTDDGSTFEAESVEIPQVNKERIVVVRNEPSGELKPVDDFIFDTNVTNSIGHVKFEHRQLEYFDAGGRLFRKKAI